jgi:hypothetical protein
LYEAVITPTPFSLAINDEFAISKKKSDSSLTAAPPFKSLLLLNSDTLKGYVSLIIT